MTIRSLLEETVAKTPGALALVYKRDGKWVERTYAQFGDGVRAVAEGYGTLFNLVPQHDHASIILSNGPEWIESYLACAGAGVAVVPVDPKLHAEEVAWILGNSEAAVVTTDSAHLPMVAELQPSLPALRGIVIVGETDVKDVNGVPVVPYSSLARAPENGEKAWFDANVARPEDVASLIYTSGTTGKPKGAMLTHANFTADAEGAYGAFSDPITQKDSFFVVLPLFHAFSFCTNFVVPMMRGCAMKFNESLRTIGDDMRALKPSVVMAVPLLVEKIYDKVRDKIDKSFFGRLLMKLGLGRVIGRSVVKGLGGNIMCIIVGGAPCPIHVLEGFRALGIPLLQGYGLTECAPVVSIAGPKAEARIGTIGYKLTNIEVRIADPNEQGIGELQIRGPITMKGYYKNEEATRETIDPEGWLCTGDLAELAPDGLLSIRGRKKALIVNREGKNIYPEEVENRIASDKIVADCIVVGYKVGNVEGDGERVGAIVHPDPDLYAEANGCEPPSPAALEKWTVRRVQELCADLADYKRPRKVKVVCEPLERTSIGKVRRVAYKDTLDE